MSIMSFQETMSLTNSQNKVLETVQIVISMGELSDKEFKMAVLRKLNDLEENRDKCFNTLRKKLYKELKEF